MVILKKKNIGCSIFLLSGVLLLSFLSSCRLARTLLEKNDSLVQDCHIIARNQSGSSYDLYYNHGGQLKYLEKHGELGCQIGNTRIVRREKYYFNNQLNYSNVKIDGYQDGFLCAYRQNELADRYHYVEKNAKSYLTRVDFSIDDDGINNSLQMTYDSDGNLNKECMVFENPDLNTGLVNIVVLYKEFDAATHFPKERWIYEGDQIDCLKFDRNQPRRETGSIQIEKNGDKTIVWKNNFGKEVEKKRYFGTPANYALEHSIAEEKAIYNHFGFVQPEYKIEVKTNCDKVPYLDPYLTDYSYFRLFNTLDE